MASVKPPIPPPTMATRKSDLIMAFASPRRVDHTGCRKAPSPRRLLARRMLNGTGFDLKARISCGRPPLFDAPAATRRDAGRLGGVHGLRRHPAASLARSGRHGHHRIAAAPDRGLHHEGYQAS